MVCSMTRTKVKVMSPWKSEIRPFSNVISSPIHNGGWQMTTDSYIRGQYLNLIGAGFLFWFLCHVTLKLAVSRSRPSVPYGANLFKLISVNLTISLGRDPCRSSCQHTDVFFITAETAVVQQSWTYSVSIILPNLRFCTLALLNECVFIFLWKTFLVQVITRWPTS